MGTPKGQNLLKSDLDLVEKLFKIKNGDEIRKIIKPCISCKIPSPHVATISHADIDEIDEHETYLGI